MATAATTPEAEPIVGDDGPPGLAEIRRRVAAEEPHRLAEIVDPGGAPIELPEGALAPETTVNPPHGASDDLPRRVPPPRSSLSTGSPIAIPERDGEREPDGAVSEGAIRDHAGRRRGPPGASIVVEVSDTSDRADRRLRWPIDGAAGIPVDSIVDPDRGPIEVVADPAGPCAQPGDRAGSTREAGDEGPAIRGGREAGRMRAGDVRP